MFNFNFKRNLMNRMFRQIDDVVWDMTSGRVGLKGSKGIVSIELGEIAEGGKEAPEAQITVNMFEEFGFAVPAFAQSTPVDKLGLGDMIYSAADKALGWIVKINDKSFDLLKQDGTKSNWRPPKVQMLGFDSGVMVLRSLMTMLPGGSGQLNQLNSMMMPLMMMSGGAKMDQLMPMILMGQMNLGTSDPAATGGAFGGMMQALMFSQLLGGGKDDGQQTSLADLRVGAELDGSGNPVRRR